MHSDCDCAFENGGFGIVFVDGTPSTVPTRSAGLGQEREKGAGPVVWVVVFVAYDENCV